jgi:mannose-6-phosphate isomerase-like protein (cupin superfamily)
MSDALAPEIELWRITHPAGFTFGDEKVKHLSGDVVLLLESGRIEVTVGNDHFCLEKGDTLHFKGTQPHAWRTISAESASVLLLGNVQAGGRSGLVERMRRLRRTAAPVASRIGASDTPTA